jgi:hypothetical protein
MKTREEILQKVERIKKENLLNEDRQKHFLKQKEFDKVKMYERMITENEIKLDVLYWILDQE